MADYIANQINWLPLQLVQQADHETPITGIAYDDADLLVRYQKQGSTSVVTKVLTADDWIEGVDGGYQVRFSAVECDIPGTLMYWVDYAGTPIAWTYMGAVALSDPADSGDTELVYTVTDGAGTALIGALVELYTDSGRTVLGPRGETNSAGQLRFRLAAVSYYPRIIYAGLIQDGTSFLGSAGAVAQTFSVPAAPSGLLSYLSLYLQPSTEPVISAAELTALVELAKRADADGNAPTSEAWTPTYDYAWCVAEGWRLKAAKVSGDYAFSDEGQSLQRQQVYDHCVAEETKWRKRCMVSSVIASSLTDEYDDDQATSSEDTL